MLKRDKNLDYVILKELKLSKNYVSGEELASKLQISRQGLWKHMGNLISKGYEIVAVPHLGYKLISSPDKLYPWEIQDSLATSFIAKQAYYNETIDSTQSAVWQLGLEGSSQGTVVLSETQKKGRGRMERKWISPKGGIYFSLLLKPNFLLIQQVPQITLLIALACLNGIKKATGVKCSVKWPNDILLKGKKLGGILCEVNAEMDKVNFVVVGIGLNVNTKDLPVNATSLFLNTKNKFSRVEITKRILEEIESCYCRAQKEGFLGLLDEWKQFCFLWGKRVRVKIFNTVIEGEATGIDEQGYLLLRRDNGFIERISAGEIVKLNVD